VAVESSLCGLKIGILDKAACYASTGTFDIPDGPEKASSVPSNGFLLAPINRSVKRSPLLPPFSSDGLSRLGEEPVDRLRFGIRDRSLLCESSR
jgi:hypothetical protein